MLKMIIWPQKRTVLYYTLKQLRNKPWPLNFVTISCKCNKYRNYAGYIQDTYCVWKTVVRSFQTVRSLAAWASLNTSDCPSMEKTGSGLAIHVNLLAFNRQTFMITKIIISTSSCFFLSDITRVYADILKFKTFKTF